ncbi:MAG: hypothetical protein M0Z79_00655 [Nitrospiraceae bacterium]|nr:hypothetical protein [Nitrospiraceae bacterium]
MSKKLLKILRMITQDLKETELYSEEVVESVVAEEPDLFDIGDELAVLESSERLEEEELDILRSLVAYILMRDNTFDREDVYSLVFAGGKRILWN